MLCKALQDCWYGGRVRQGATVDCTAPANRFPLYLRPVDARHRRQVEEAMGVVYEDGANRARPLRQGESVPPLLELVAEPDDEALDDIDEV